jgi:hypothetical protein
LLSDRIELFHPDRHEALMKARTIVVYSLLVASLLAQTKNSPAESSSKSKATAAPVSSTTDARIEPGKEADIRKLMDLIGTRELVSQMMDSMEKSIKPLMASALPPGDYRGTLIDFFFAKFHSKAAVQQLLDIAVPSYDKYYTHKEVQELIQFYGTPLGQKTISVLPKLTGELQDAGRKWGEGLGRDSMREVLSEHPDLAKALEDAKKKMRPQE